MLEITSLFVACGFLDGKLLCYNPLVSDSFIKSLWMKIQNTGSVRLGLGLPRAQSSRRGARGEAEGGRRMLFARRTSILFSRKGHL